MRKYDLLKYIYETQKGTTALELSKKIDSALPNIYVYLQQLLNEDLIQKTGGKYCLNESNAKLKTILELQAMTDKFHVLISPSFKSLISKFCRNLEVYKNDFSSSESVKIKKVLVPLRIVLTLSKKPVRYCLKINESIVRSLLDYHDLTHHFGLNDFNKLVGSAPFKPVVGIPQSPESDPRVVELCDSFHDAGLDLSILKKIQDPTFTLDERNSELLKSAEQTNKEYTLFINALNETDRRSFLEIWENKYIYNTNKIEGNTMSEMDVKDYLKSGKPTPGVSKRELFETTNMRHALQFLNLKGDEDITESLICELHFQVQKDIADDAGRYKNHYNYINSALMSPTTPPQHVSERMKQLVSWYRESKDSIPPFLLASVFHMQFEIIHPFADGNGRVGRLIINHILKLKGYKPITILEKTKQEYYRALENRSIPQFLLYTLTSFIEEYKR